MTKCLTLVQGRSVRVTQLDSCFRPVYGESSVAQSEGFISLGTTLNTISTDAITVTNANGKLAVNIPEEPKFSNYGVEIVFSQVDPDLFALATGQEAYYNAAGEVIGFTVGTDSVKLGNVAIEVWVGATGGDVCDDPDAEGEFGYILLPALRGGNVSDFSIENGAVSFTVTGLATRDGNRWGTGPFPVLLEEGIPAVLPTPISTKKHLLAISTTLTPPEGVCGTRPLMDPAATPITTVTATTTPASLVVAFATTPTPTGIPVWIDFGDGTWDWLPGSANGATSHTYEAAGTYEVKATTNGVWKTTTVTVPGV